MNLSSLLRIPLPAVLPLVIGCCAVLLSGCASTNSTRAPHGSQAEITALLQSQVQAWNRGDLEGFMRGYLASDSLRFASGGNVRYGWQATLDSYRRGYPDRATMGTLTFSDLDVRLLGPDDGYVFGRWALARDSSFAPASGLFTLVLHRTGDGWRIVHDHTSSAD